MIGTANSIHSMNVIRTSRKSPSMPITIRFGGVPTGVAMPPREHPSAVISISAVPYERGTSLSDSMNAMRDIPIGTSIAAVAVLLIHAERNAASTPYAIRIRVGRAPITFHDKTL